MIHPEYEYWTNKDGTFHMSELKDDHLLNIFDMLKRRKEKDMQFVAVQEEIKSRRGL